MLNGDITTLGSSVHVLHFSKVDTKPSLGIINQPPQPAGSEGAGALLLK